MFTDVPNEVLPEALVNPTALELYFRQIDKGSPFSHVCLEQIEAASTQTLATIKTKCVDDIDRYNFLLDICNRVSTQLTKKYHAITLVQAKIVSESSVNFSTAYHFEKAEHTSHDLHHGLEIASTIAHKTGLKEAESLFHLFGIPATACLLLFNFIAHSIKHNEVAAHPATLLNSLNTQNLTSIFRAVCIEVIFSWIDNIPTSEAYNLKNIARWESKLLSSIDSSFHALSQMHTELSLQDIHDRITILTKNQNEELIMTQKRYLVAENPFVIEIYKILQGISQSKESHRKVTSEVNDNITNNQNISGRFLFDVLEVFLKPNSEVADQNMCWSVCCGYLIASVQSLRKHVERTNHALSEISAYLIRDEAKVDVPNYQFQKYLIDNLLYNYLKKYALDELPWCQSLKNIYRQHDASFYSLTLDYQEGSEFFVVNAHADLLQISSVDELQSMVVAKDLEIEKLNGELIKSAQALKDSKAENTVLLTEKMEVDGKNKELKSENTELKSEKVKFTAENTKQSKEIQRLQKNQDLILKELEKLKQARAANNNEQSQPQSSRAFG